MNVFDGTAFVYDIALAPLELAGLSRLRQGLISEARGAVLEIGAGTGRNLPHYTQGTRVFALDESAEMLTTARKRPCRVCATVTRGDAQTLPFASHTFDTVVGTLVLCSIPDPARALCEIRRVLRPGGKLLLIEHTRGHHPVAAALTNVLNPAWFALKGKRRDAAQSREGFVTCGKNRDKRNGRRATACRRHFGHGRLQ
jgi:ubiquinone/menaquinone biosynthesis C-methylase UbiE